MAEWTPYEHDLDAMVIERFTLVERVQHIVLMISMVVLIVTGVPLLLHEVGYRLPQGSFGFRTWLHHFAGAVLIGLSVFHMGYVMFTDQGRRDFARILPTFQDVRDLIQFVKYQTGHADEPPHYGKFDPFEKFEYLAVVWGSIVMIVTGLVMWFFEVTLQMFPKWVYDVAILIHGYEAILAFSAIILGHMYTVHLKPGVFPMSRVWLDGTVTLREMKEHHPREYEKWLRKQRILRAEQAPGEGA